MNCIDPGRATHVVLCHDGRGLVVQRDHRAVALDVAQRGRGQRKEELGLRLGLHQLLGDDLELRGIDIGQPSLAWHGAVTQRAVVKPLAHGFAGECEESVIGKVMAADGSPS